MRSDGAQHGETLVPRVSVGALGRSFREEMKQNCQVPAFLSKLRTLVDDSCTNQLVCWNEEGCSFVVLDEQRFSKEVLPLYYKHCNMTSFIRQLNMYGFHKVVPVDSGLLKEEGRGDSMEFQHEHFRKDQPHLLTLIHRKVSISRGVDEAGQISQILMEISQARGWQDSYDFKLMTLCRDNESLWRELNSLQQKHQQQHRIICKIMQFIINTVGSKRVKGLKRKIPMIEIAGETHSAPKYSRPSDSSLDSNLPSSFMPEIPLPQDIPLDSLSAGVYSNGMIFPDTTHLLEPLPEQDSGPVVQNAPCCPHTPLFTALSPADLTLSLLDNTADQDMAEKLPERNDLVDSLSLIDSSLAALQAYPLSPSLDTLDELFRLSSESDTHALKRKRDTKQGGNTHSHKYTARRVRPVLQHEELSFVGDSVEADILPSLLRLAQEASIPLHTDTLSL